MQQIITAYKDAWLNWNNFSGRSRRSAYWYAFLANVIIAFVLGFVSGLVEALTILTILVTIYSLLVLVPYIALAVRRLHDTGHSGWWYLIALTGIGCIVLLIWFCQDSQPDNQYGPSPKGYSAPGGPQAPYNPQPPQGGNTYGNGPEL